MKNRQYIPLFYILALSVVLRLVIINQSFWLDEAIGALAVKERNLTSIISAFPRGDNHPPLYYMLLDIWSNLFGYTEIALRSLSVIFGVAAIVVVYKIAEVIGNTTKSFKYLAAAFMATSGLHIYYSQEARMYILTGFFAALAIYYFIRTLQDTNYKLWLGFSIAITLLVFTDYTPFFMLPIFLIIALYIGKNLKWYRNFVLSFIPLVVLGLLWLPTFIFQVRAGEQFLQALPEWKVIAGGTSLKQVLLVWVKFVVGRISLPNKLVYYVYILVASSPFLVALISALKKKSELLLVKLWLVIPLMLVYLFSFKTPAFIYFRFNFILPAFYLILAYGVSQLTSAKLRYVVAIGILCVNFIGIGIYWGSGLQHRENWRDAVKAVEASVQNSEIVIFENQEPFAPYRWYSLASGNAYGATDALKATNLTKEKTANLVKDAPGVWYFEYLHDLNDPDDYVRQTLGDEGFELSKVYTYNGVGQVFYYVR